jgi:nucleoside-diphosphate-sugar epimerase
VEDSANSRNEKNSNLVSRNRPVALVVNTCAFLGAQLSRQLLDKGIQVIGVDDLSYADKRRIESSVKDKDFHLINAGIDQEDIIERFENLGINRLDYAFFITDEGVPDIILGKGVVNFIKLSARIRELSLGSAEKDVASDRPRLIFTSSINLYGKSLEGKDRILRESEAKFAKGIKHFKLNGRVVRLAEVFGPGMDLERNNPLARMISAAINDKLDQVNISLDFSERGLYVDDAVSLLIKSVLSGSTSNKIFDGALLHPIRLSEIKQIIADPVWSEENPPVLTKLPAWPTPNLLKTMKELSWSARTPLLKALRETMAFFKERQELVPREDNKKPAFDSSKSWSFEGTGFLKKDETENTKEEKSPGGKQKVRSEESEFEETRVKRGSVKKVFLAVVFGLIIVYGLIWPAAYLGYQAFNIKNHLAASKTYLEEGDFEKSENEIEEARKSLEVYKTLLENAQILKKIPKISDAVGKAEQIVEVTSEGVDGALYATGGSRALFETTKIISGESREDPTQFYLQAERELEYASTKLSKVYANLGEESLMEGLPSFLNDRLEDLRVRVGYYQSLVEQAKSASKLMPKITALGGKKSYLVLLQNNLELRPTGGFIGSYAKLDFENGRLTNIKVDDIYNLDGALKEVIAPPQDLRNDLNLERLYLRDSNFDPDFPTSARQAEFFYKKEAGETVHGVIALDLKASGYLLDAVGGIDLPEYGEQVSGVNLFERAISHAETNFFPGSQAKKNYLTSLQNQLFNKIFYLSKQNWPAIIQAISKSLKEKHMLVYLEDPSLFSYLASSNWSGVFPRAGEAREGETSDFLAVIESNMGANKANYFLQRKYTLNVSFTKEGKVMHNLKINYKNTSPSEIFPAGIYKNRIKVYTPLGSKLTKATFGETDVTSQFVGFSDYGRSAFSALIQIAPKETKSLVLEYELKDPLSFKENNSIYKIEVFKQPGTISDPLDFILTYPINYKIEEKPGEGSTGVQEVKIVTDMLTDRVFQFKVKK